MPSHGSVAAINKVQNRAHPGYRSKVRVGSRTTPPSTAPTNTITPAGRAARRYTAAYNILQQPTIPSLASLPAGIQPYIGSVLDAAKRYNVDPALLLGQEQTESGFNPANYSRRNYAGAGGISQFIPSTGAQYGVRLGTSKAAVRSQIMGQAHYMHDLGVSSNPTEALNRYWGRGGSAPTSYSQGVLANAQRFQGALGPSQQAKEKRQQAQATVSRLAARGYGFPPVAGGQPVVQPVSKRFVNPLPGWSQSRTDMGIDFSAPAGTPIRAMGKGRFLGVGQGPGWPGIPSGETGILYKVKKSKGLPSPYIFDYEGVSTNPNLRPGQKIHKGDILGTGSGGGIETGYATSSGSTLSVAHGTQSQSGDPGAVPTPEGRAYQNLLAKLPGSTVTKGSALPVSAGGFSTGASPGYSAGFGGAVPTDSGGSTAQPKMAPYVPAYPSSGRGGFAASAAVPLATSDLQAALASILGGGSTAKQGASNSAVPILQQILQRQRFRPRR